MTDQAATDAPAGNQGQPRQPLPQVQILSQYVKDLSFENPNAPEIYKPGTAQPQVQVNVGVNSRNLEEGRYEVTLNIKADAKSGEQQAFLVELAYAGVAALPNATKEQVPPLLLVEVPRLLFPFARSVIADATRDGGFPPLMVQPVDFVDLFRRQLQALRARQGQGAAPTSLSDTTPPGNA